MSLEPTCRQVHLRLWTVGWQARDPFGDAAREPVDPVESVTRLARWAPTASISTMTTLFPSSSATLTEKPHWCDSRRR